MKNTEHSENLAYVLQRVKTGSRVRFVDDHYGNFYALTYPATRLFPRFLLALKRGTRLTSVEVSVVKETIRTQINSPMPM